MKNKIFQLPARNYTASDNFAQWYHVLYYKYIKCLFYFWGTLSRRCQFILRTNVYLYSNLNETFSQSSEGLFFPDVRYNLRTRPILRTNTHSRRIYSHNNIYYEVYKSSIPQSIAHCCIASSTNVSFAFILRLFSIRFLYTAPATQFL